MLFDATKFNICKFYISCNYCTWELKLYFFNEFMIITLFLGHQVQNSWNCYVLSSQCHLCVLQTEMNH